MEKQRRLYRSEKERLLGGVCGGLAEYFKTDPVLVRVIFVLLTLFVGRSSRACGLYSPVDHHSAGLQPRPLRQGSDEREH